jgi:hypothetical protein
MLFEQTLNIRTNRMKLFSDDIAGTLFEQSPLFYNPAQGIIRRIEHAEAATPLDSVRRAAIVTQLYHRPGEVA